MKKMTGKAMTKANGGAGFWDYWWGGVCQIFNISRIPEPKTTTGNAISNNLNNRAQYDALIGIKH